MPINPADQLGDPEYRYYNCNLQTPKIKCGNLTADKYTLGALSSSGIITYDGIFPFSNTFIFTTSHIPLLANDNMSGELTLYLRNETADYSNVTLSIVTKAGGTIQQTNIYQRIGNMTSVDMTSASSTTVTVTTSPYVRCYWVFRGV
jgi:hypothetical protein